MKIVLLIDDDPLFAELVEASLSTREQVLVLRATNGFEALRMIDTYHKKLDLIVCDVNMPHCDGIEVVEELGRRHVTTPIMFATGAAPLIVTAIDKLARVLELSVIDTQTKPVNLDYFSGVATTAMGSASASRQDLHCFDG